jgi:hypothetical protein
MKDLIPYQEALELKQLGFDEPCMAFYDGKGNSTIYYNSLRDGSGDYKPFKATERLKWFGSPTYSQAFRWFREKYQVVGIVKFGSNDFTYNIYNEDAIGLLTKDSLNFNGTYEEAELACLKKLIEIVKQRQP